VDDRRDGVLVWGGEVSEHVDTGRDGRRATLVVRCDKNLDLEQSCLNVQLILECDHVVLPVVRQLTAKVLWEICIISEKYSGVRRGISTPQEQDVDALETTTGPRWKARNHSVGP
jgi:hypothetical protein